jgi:hypothetical protein
MNFFMKKIDQTVFLVPNQNMVAILFIFIVWKNVVDSVCVFIMISFHWNVDLIETSVPFIPTSF